MHVLGHWTCNVHAVCYMHVVCYAPSACCIHVVYELLIQVAIFFALPTTIKFLQKGPALCDAQDTRQSCHVLGV